MKTERKPRKIKVNCQFCKRQWDAVEGAPHMHVEPDTTYEHYCDTYRGWIEARQTCGYVIDEKELNAFFTVTRRRSYIHDLEDKVEELETEKREAIEALNELKSYLLSDKFRGNNSSEVEVGDVLYRLEKVRLYTID